MADITGASLGSIKNRLSGAATYHPMEAETFSDWATEAGDVVTVKRGNESYNSPVYSSKLVWKGAPQMTLSSTGNKERESLQKVSSKKYRKNGAALRNSQRLQQHLQDAYGNLKSYFEVTESRMYAEFNGKYDGLSSHFEVTRSRMAADFQGKYDGLSSHFEVTRSQMAADFQGKYDGLSSHFDVTRSQMAADFQGKYDGLSSHFEVTRSQMAADFQGKHDGLSSHFEVTRSQMAADFQGKYDGLSSHFEVTRSNFNVSVSNYYNQLSSGISVTSSTLTNYVDGKTSRASLLLTINGSGKSNAKLEADVINIDGNDSVTLSDVLTVDTSGNDSIVRIKTTKLRVGTSSTNLVTLTDGIFTATEYHYKDLVNKTVEPMLMKASVDGNTLKIWKFGDAANAPSVTFSKATTLNPTWSSGNFPLTINMQQTNDGVTTNVGTPKTIGFTNANDIYLEIDKNGDIAAFGTSRKVINVPYKITQKQTINGVNQDSIRYTGSIAAVDATSVYNNGWNDARTATEIPTTDIGSTSIDSTYGTVTVKKPNADGVSTKTSYDYSINLTNYTPPGTTTKIGISEIKYSSNVVARKTITNLQAGNIKAGVSICGISGTFTSDADATAARILNGYTAYVDGSKVTGSIPTSSNSGTTITPGTSSKTAINGGHYASSNITVAGDSDLTAGNIKSGVTIFGVTGSFTSDADAAAGHILSGKTAYVNGSKITGSIPTSSNSGTTITPGTSNQTAISLGQYASAAITVAGDSDLTAGNIKKGVTIFGVTGSYTSDATAAAGHILSGKTAYVNGSKITGTIPTSSNSGTTITPGTSEKTAINAGQYASSNIKVAGDSDLVAGNIKKDVTIFGVTGSYQSSVTDISMWTGQDEWTGNQTISGAWTITAYAKVDGTWKSGSSVTISPTLSASKCAIWTTNGTTWTKRSGNITIGITGSITLYPWYDTVQGDTVTVSCSYSSMNLTYWKAEKDENTWYYYWYGTKNDHPASGSSRTFYY